MRWPLLLLLVAPASAAEFDIDAPGFWSRSYSIPRSYCERHIKVSFKRVDEIIKDAAPCEFTINNGVASSDCPLSSAVADNIVSRLRNKGTMLSYSKRCDPAPSHPELYYKRDNLTREYEELGLPDEKLQAVTGLLIAQLDTLNALISSHEAALQTNLAIDILPSDSPPAVDDQPRRIKRAQKIKRAAKQINLVGSRAEAAMGGWLRQPRPVCSQIHSVSAVYERKGPPTDSKRLEVIRRLGENYEDASCPPLRDPQLAAAIFSVKPAKEILKRLTSLPDLRSLKNDSSVFADRRAADGYVPDDRRFDELTAELEARRTELERAPHIRALANAEIARVKDNATLLKRLRAGSLILVWFAN
ncbi:MAG: hypothetical protein M0D55_17745 [Elusimicrobiota bacterium]|nr:MAG: hypothetical protein M0D55_17745 [Elusimicrobiota bacterium]